MITHRPQKPQEHIVESVDAFWCGRESEHMFGLNGHECLREMFSAEMMALIEDGEPESTERVERPITTSHCLNHANRAIVFHGFFSGLYSSQAG